MSSLAYLTLFLILVTLIHWSYMLNSDLSCRKVIAEVITKDHNLAVEMSLLC